MLTISEVVINALLRISNSNKEKLLRAIICAYIGDDLEALILPTDQKFSQFLVDTKYKISLSTTDDWTRGRVAIPSHGGLWFTVVSRSSVGHSIGKIIADDLARLETKMALVDPEPTVIINENLNKRKLLVWTAEAHNWEWE